MSPADRAKLGPAGLTSEEAMEAYECRTERELQELLYQWLIVHRGVNRVVRSRMDKKTTRDVGDPDFLFICDGIPRAWEIKTATGVVSAAQHKAAIAFLKDGWHYHVIRSFAEAKAALGAE